MVNRVLITYECSPLSEVAFLISQMRSETTSLEDMVPICPTNRRSKEILRQLAQQGIEITHLRDYFPGGVTDGTFQRGVYHLAEKADLIFHDTSRFLHQVPRHEVVDTYRAQLNRAISGFLWKTHIERDNPNTSKRRAIELVAAHGGIRTPKIWTVDEFLAHPQYPAVFQGRFASMGEVVTYIPNSEAAGRVMPKGVDYYRDKADFYEFIQTPSDHFTSYRIITFADGSIMAAVMQASRRKKSREGFANITSNHATGSNQIPFSPTEKSAAISERDYGILVAHGISKDHVQLPQELEKQAGEVARLFARYGVLWSGQDWLQDREGNFHFKEINIFPGMEAFNTLFMNGKTSEDYWESHRINQEAERIGIEIIVNHIKRYTPAR